MITAQNFKTISELRQQTAKIVETVEMKNKPIYIISRSKPKAVLLNIDEYAKLLALKRENDLLKKKLST